ncbi:hypothetical protein [Rummeliibacillus stabekisii]
MTITIKEMYKRLNLIFFLTEEICLSDAVWFYGGLSLMTLFFLVPIVF